MDEKSIHGRKKKDAHATSVGDEIALLSGRVGGLVEELLEQDELGLAEPLACAADALAGAFGAVVRLEAGHRGRARQRRRAAVSEHDGHRGG